MNATETLALLRGDWQAEARAPYEVSDPLKARHLLGYDQEPPPAVRQLHERGVMPCSVLMRAIPRLDFKARAELEKLLSGGDILWTETWKNRVVNEGLNYILSVGLVAGTPDTTWFIGLTDSTPTDAAADTLASHAGWVEVTAYTPGPGTRQAWVPGAVASQQTVGSHVTPFTINAINTVIGGAFLAGVATGTAGSLYAVGAFSADRTLQTSETLTVTITATAASP